MSVDSKHVKRNRFQLYNVAVRLSENKTYHCTRNDVDGIALCTLS